MGGVARRSLQRLICAAQDAIRARGSHFASQSGDSVGCGGPKCKKRIHCRPKIIGNSARLRQREAGRGRYRRVANFCVGNNTGHRSR